MLASTKRTVKSGVPVKSDGTPEKVVSNPAGPTAFRIRNGAAVVVDGVPFITVPVGFSR